jgi:hypothetical protein
MTLDAGAAFRAILGGPDFQVEDPRSDDHETFATPLANQRALL